MPKEHEPTPRPLTLEAVAAVVKEVALANGRYPPTLIVEGTNGSVVGEVGNLALTHEERLRQLFSSGFALARAQEIGALRQVFFVSEGWMSASPVGKPPEFKPSEDPNRRQVLLISTWDVRSGENRLVIFEMTRDSQGRLSELQPFQPIEVEVDRVDSPLLMSFVQGFWVGKVGFPNLTS